MPELFAHQYTSPATHGNAVALQNELRNQVKRTNSFAPDSIRTIAGIDVSVNRQQVTTNVTEKGEAEIAEESVGTAAVVVVAYPDLAPQDQATSSGIITFPYIPGLLSFREVPLVLSALQQLSSLPDLLMVDGQGIAHPRRFGIACHLALLTGIPAIGVAKSVLVGEYAPVGAEAGSQSFLIHRGETIGVMLRSKPRTNPLVISPGSGIDLETAVYFVQTCLRGYRLPEPTRLAHNLAGGKIIVQRAKDRYTEGGLL